jgi:hypothetical protein
MIFFYDPTLVPDSGTRILFKKVSKWGEIGSIKVKKSTLIDSILLLMKRSFC